MYKKIKRFHEPNSNLSTVLQLLKIIVHYTGWGNDEVVKAIHFRRKYQ
jgi:hypothetical protein